MNIVTKFILIISAISIVTAVGYISRRKSWLREKDAGSIMFYSVLFGWTPASVFVLWKLNLQFSLISLPIFNVAIATCLLPIATILAVKVYKLETKTAGTFVVASTISNIGFTMGGFVCYCLFGMTGLGYAQLYCASWTIPIIGYCYPIARKYGTPDEKFDIIFILKTFADRRSLPILGTIAGLTANIAGIPKIDFVYDFYLVDTVILIAVLASFFCIGLHLHFSSITEHINLQIAVSVLKFVISPLIAVLFLALNEKILPLPDTATKVVLIESLTPTAVFTVIIANLFHLKPKLASMFFLVNTAVFLVIVLPVIVYLWG